MQSSVCNYNFVWYFAHQNLDNYSSYQTLLTVDSFLKVYVSVPNQRLSR